MCFDETFVSVTNEFSKKMQRLYREMNYLLKILKK